MLHLCRTDFTCCHKEHSYYYGDNNHHDIGLAFNDKVGTCDCEWHRHAVQVLALQCSLQLLCISVAECRAYYC